MHQRRKVLLIDDEPDFCFFLKCNLERTGDFEVMTAGTGEEGIELARRMKPDLILLDLHMPGLSGDDVAVTLKESDQTAAIPIVFLTALVKRREMENRTLKVIGGQYFIAKPVTTNRLVAAIREIATG